MTDHMATVYVDRTGWPKGPWDDEPLDRWEAEHQGFPLLVTRHPDGHLCGYVGLSPSHPWYDQNYQEVPANVHGGLSYGRRCHDRVCHVPKPGETDAVYWLGFDAGQICDATPETAQMAIEHPGLFRQGRTYRDHHYMLNACRELADQAADAL